VSALSDTSIVVCPPANEAERDAYYRLRWEVLRRPHGLPQGSERHPFDADSEHLVAKAGGRVVGAGCFRVSSVARPGVTRRLRIPRLGRREVALIRQIAVADDCRGQGVGDAIMAEMERLALAGGAHHFVVNARADVVGFFERRGYEKTGPGPTRFGSVQHVVMEKPGTSTKQRRGRP
jgi:GNAT superfamily N-acetyltransferase